MAKLNSHEDLRIKIIGSCMKYGLTLLVNTILVMLLVGCDNSVRNNVGALPPIDINGRLMVGPVRYAKVQLVGIDQYGQPQKIDADNYYGDTHYTDENGDFSAQIQGAYTGALMAIAASAEYTVTTVAATSTTAAVTETRRTQIRCTLADGCLDYDKNAVAYGDWFNVPVPGEGRDDQVLELRAVLPDVQGAENGLDLNISFLTHLAAQLAYVEYVSDGTSCTTGSCDGQIKVDGVLTPQAIFEANTRVQKQFFTQTAQPVSVRPWSVFSQSVSTESIEALAQTFHGVSAVHWLMESKAENETLTETLARFESVYLSGVNQGQLFGESGTEWDFKTYYQSMVDYVSSIESKADDASLLMQVKTAAQSSLDASVGQGLSAITGDEYAASLDEKITAAREMVARVQGWVIDLSQTGTGKDQYDLFFDADFAKDLSDMEIELEKFKKTLSPHLQSFFVPMVEFAEFALLCSRTAAGSCSASSMLNHPEQSFDTDLLQYTASSESLLLNKQDAFPKYLLQGRFDESDAGALVRRFYFDRDIVVETDQGRVEVKSVNGVYPSLTLSYTASLNGSTIPDISRIQLNIPKLQIKSKSVENVYDSLFFIAENVALDMYGVKDATRSSEPRHFNISTLDFPGQLQEGDEKFDVGLNLISQNPGKYYPERMFPDLGVVIDAEAFKNYAKFETTDIANAELAGFLAVTSDVLLDNVLEDEVSYTEGDSYSQLDSGLRQVLGLDGAYQVQYGALNYSGGSDVIIVWKDESTSVNSMARQCKEVDGIWLCPEPAVALSNIGCETAFGQAHAEIKEVFALLYDQSCIANVLINGRGSYTVNYGDNQFVEGERYDAVLKTPYRLGLKSFNLRLLSRFIDESTGLQRPSALLNVLGAATDTIGIQGAVSDLDLSVAVSLTHNYIGFSNSTTAGLYEIFPYGDHTLWFAMGQDSEANNNALVYYIQDENNVALTMTGFDKTLNHAEEDGPIGYLKFAGSVVGTLRKEGGSSGLYVIRYADGSWQLL